MSEQHTVLVVAVTLGCGALLFRWADQAGIPFSVLVYLCGITFGLLCVSFAPEYVAGLQAFSPSLIFHVFLPILIFEGSYGMRVHALYRVYGKAVLLAGPGLLLNTVLVAVPLKQLLFPEWSWASALLLGSVLSATDPVAVVSLLKGLGVDHHLSALIDGEAIMNDGTAIVLFRVLYPSAVLAPLLASSSAAAPLGILPGLPGPAAIALNMLQLTAGAYVLGKLFGHVQAFFINRLRGDAITTTSINLSVTFVSYYVAEDIAGTSGVLTLFFQGLHVSYFVPSMFPGTPTDTMHIIWEFLVRFGNMLLFFLVGIILSECSPSEMAADLGSILVLYVILYVARLAMLVLLLPLLNVTGPPVFHVGWRQTLLMAHSGLRGGIAVVLALSVARDKSFPLGQRFLRLTSGVVCLTLVINGTTASRAVAYLGFGVLKQNRHVQMRVALHALQRERDAALADLSKDPTYALAQMDVVQRTLDATSANPYAALGVIAETDDETIMALLMRVFKVSVWQQRDAELISERVARLLTGAVAVCTATARPLTAEDLPEVRLSAYLRYAMAVVPHAVRRRWHAAALEDQFALLLAAGEAYRAVAHAAPVYTVSTASRELVLVWARRQLLGVEAKVRAFAAAHPAGVAASATTAMAVRVAVARCAGAVDALHRHSGVTATVCELLLHRVTAIHVSRRAKAAMVLDDTAEEGVASADHVGGTLTADTRALLRGTADVLAMYDLSPDACAQVARAMLLGSSEGGGEAADAPPPLAAVARCRPGQSLSTSDGIYLVLRGVLSSAQGPHPLGRGELVGAAAHLLPAAAQLPPAEEFTCVSDVVCLCMHADRLRRALAGRGGVAWKAVARDTVVPQLVARRDSFLPGWTEAAIARAVCRGQVLAFAPDGAADAAAASPFGGSFSPPFHQALFAASIEADGSPPPMHASDSNRVVGIHHFMHPAFQHARSVVVLLSGAEASGFYTASSRPCIVPKLLLLRHGAWLPGSVFLHVFFRLTPNELSSAVPGDPSAADAAGNGSGLSPYSMAGSSDTAATPSTGGEAAGGEISQGSAAAAAAQFAQASPVRHRRHRGRHWQFFDVAQLASQSPAVNALTNDFLWFEEMADVGSSITLPGPQQVVFTQTVHFLLRFASLMPALERDLFDASCTAAAAAANQHVHRRAHAEEPNSSTPRSRRLAAEGQQLALLRRDVDMSWHGFSATLQAILSTQGPATQAALNFYPIQPLRGGDGEADGGARTAGATGDMGGIEASGLASSRGGSVPTTVAAAVPSPLPAAAGHGTGHWDLARLSAWMLQFVVQHCAVRGRCLAAHVAAVRDEL